MRRYIYHYHVFWQVEPGSLSHADGLVLKVKPVITFDDYGALKKLISEAREAPIDRMTVGSLALIGREPFFRRALPGAEK